MKVLFDHPSPFLLAHGGFQIQIEQTKAGLEANGLEVEFLRWWDDRQRGDLIHYFGIANYAYLRQAKSVQLPVVMTSLFTETCNRSDSRLARQGRLVRFILRSPIGEGIKQQLNWRSFATCDRNVVGLNAERVVLRQVYQISDNKISVVPLGLSDTYLQSGPGERNQPHLICTGTITRRKNFIPLAEMARSSETPILFVGKPYHANDDYWLRFKKLIDGRWVKHHPHVENEAQMIALLRGARGFVLMSDFENWCLSAHEAIACGLPVLVPDQKWSRERFGGQAQYFATVGNTPRNLEILRRFYKDAPGLSAPAIKLHSWSEVGAQLKAVYDRVLSTSS